jgi:hypothetical protein
LAEAQLAVVEGQLALIDAGREMVAAGPEGVRLFRQLAKAAGLTVAQTQALLDNYGALATGAFLGAPTVLQTGNVVDPATGLPVPAPTLPPGWATGPAQGPWATLFSGLGLIPGIPDFGAGAGAGGADLAAYGTPEVMVVAGPSGTVGSTTVIQSLNVRVRGILDLRDPQQVDVLCDAIEAELITRGIGGA